MSSSLAMPAPGPGTVHLALIRTGIELFGVEYTRDELFPVIRSAEIRIRPPERVAISTQLIRAYKANHGKSGSVRLAESPVYREFAHATGLMTVYIKVPLSHEDDCCKMMRAIGYWGQASSMAYCIQIHHTKPKDGQYAIPLKTIKMTSPTQNFFSCFISELRDDQVNWNDLMPQQGKGQAVRIDLYVWPMIISERRGGGKILRRCSLVKNIGAN